jgi:hypothetical protein
VEEDAIRTKYYAEVEDLLKKHVPGAKRVFIFDHTIRRNYEGKEGLYVSGPAVSRLCANDHEQTLLITYLMTQYRVHVDQTFEAGIQRVYRHLPEDAERLVKSRVRIINVWRPIGHPVHHNPLALFDYRTVDVDNDLVNVRFIYPDRVGGTFTVRHNPKHQWYYLRHQTPSEATLIKCFDSLDQGQARLTPHSAFLDKTSPPDALKRESIEIRALVFDSK